MKNNLYYCSSCKHKLTKKKHKNSYYYNCEQCKKTYPITKSNIACLFEEQKKVIAQSYSDCCQTSNNWNNKALSLSNSLKQSSRKKSLLPLLHAYNHNERLFSDWAKDIEELVDRQTLATTRTDNKFNQYGYNFNYLSQDWGVESTNNAVLDLQTSLKRVMRLVGKRGRAGALGVGAGRFGLELGNYFDEILGIDSSFAQVIQYHSLLENDINFWNTETRNQLKTSKFAQKNNCKIPDELRDNRQKFEFLWGDAFNFPCPDHHFDWLFSVYFSDIQPLHKLVDETLRILKPNGYFAHIGPLEYHFRDIEFHYSLEEFKQQFIKHGFTIIHQSFTEPDLKSSDNSVKITGQYQDAVLLLQRQST